MKIGEDLALFQRTNQIHGYHDTINGLRWSICTGVIDGVWQTIVRNDEGRSEGDFGEPVKVEKHGGGLDAKKRHYEIIQELKKK